MCRNLSIFEQDIDSQQTLLIVSELEHGLFQDIC